MIRRVAIPLVKRARFYASTVPGQTSVRNPLTRNDQAFNDNVEKNVAPQKKSLEFDESSTSEHWDPVLAKRNSNKDIDTNVVDLGSHDIKSDHPDAAGG
jgi:hypothetical protein